MRLLNLPLPIFAAILTPQLETAAQSPTPGWVAAVAAWIFVLGWFLQQWGKLPGANGERRTHMFTPQDRARMEAIYGAVKRNDPEKPDWPMVWSATHETVTRLAELAELWQEDREAWKYERARMEVRITQLEEVVRLQEHALGARK